MKPFTLSEGMSKASKDHNEDLGPCGLVGHVGKDKSTHWERIERYGKV